MALNQVRFGGCGTGEEGTTAQQTALVALSDLGSVAGKSRALSEGALGASLPDSVQQRQ